jgi:hypothetical protein
MAGAVPAGVDHHLGGLHPSGRASEPVTKPMPRYFFHTQIGEDVITDPTGTELRDPDEAWEKARATIRAALRSPQEQARLMAACLVVADAAGEVVFEFPFSEAVTLPAPEDPTVH